jgi:hypothetical protein
LTRHCKAWRGDQPGKEQDMGWLVLVTLAFLAVMAGGTPLRDSVDVQLVRSAENELEAWVTWGDEGMGIQINAKSNRLSIQSNRGEILIYGEKIDGSGTFYSAQGHSFFATETPVSDGTLTKTEYAVPSSMESEAKEAFKQKKIQRMLGSFDQNGARQSSEGAIRELVQRPEIKILEETARILGERGVIGAENDGALLFYMTVMNMLRGREGHTSRRSAERETQSFKRRHRALDTEREKDNNQEKVLCLPTVSPSPSVTSDDVPDCTEVTKTIVSTRGSTHTRTYTYTICPTPTASPKPSVLSSPCIANTPPKTSVVPCPSPPPTDYDPPSNDTEDYYPYSPDRCAIPIPEGVHPCREDNSWTLLCEDCDHERECRRGRCPLDECLGMCGPGCWWCWSWVCGDCCYWKGCHEHDNECRESFFSFACLLPFNFRCNGYL